MNLKFSIKRPIYFHNLLIKITFFIMLTVLVLSFFLNYNFKNYSIALLNNSNEKLMEQIYQNALQVNSNVKNYATAMFNNPDTANLMFGEDLPMDDVLRSMRNLELSFGSLPYMHSGYIYNGRKDTYYVTGPGSVIRKGNFFDKELVQMLVNPARLPALYPIPRKIPMADLKQDEFVNVFSYILPEYYAGTNTVKNALILNVNISSIFNTLATFHELDSLKGNNIIILNSQGKVVASSDPKEDMFLQDLSGDPFVSTILESENKTGVIQGDFKGIPSVFTYVSDHSSPWILVNITPESYISESISKIKRITTSIGMFMFIICLLTAFLLAKNLYAPVRSLRSLVGQLYDPHRTKLDERNEFDYMTDTLESFRRSNLFALKQKQLNELLYSSDKQGANYNVLFKEHGIEIDPRSSVVVILLKIDNYSAFRSKYSLKDQSLMKYALLNIVNEILQLNYPCESFDAGDDLVAVIVNMEEESAENGGPPIYAKQLSDLIGEVQSVYRKYCSISVSAFISQPGESIRKVRELFEEAVELSTYRIKYGHSCLLSNKELSHAPSADAHINHDLIGQFLEALNKARTEDACKLYYDVILCLSNSSYNNIMFTLSYMSSSIFNMISLMEKNGTVSFALDFVSFDNKVKTQETFEQINAEFMSLIETIIGRIEQNRDEKSELVVSNVIRYIDTHYMDISLSANLVAEHFKLTLPYLRKLFRDHASRSIADYISEVRLEKIAKLLSETSLSIDEILERVGWENKKHFYTLFKKKYGATSTEYRLKAKVSRI